MEGLGRLVDKYIKRVDQYNNEIENCGKKLREIDKEKAFKEQIVEKLTLGLHKSTLKKTIKILENVYKLTEDAELKSAIWEENKGDSLTKKLRELGENVRILEEEIKNNKDASSIYRELYLGCVDRLPLNSIPERINNIIENKRDACNYTIP